MREDRFVAVFTRKHEKKTRFSSRVDIVEFKHPGVDGENNPLTVQLILTPNRFDDPTLPREHKIVVFHSDGAFSTDLDELSDICLYFNYHETYYKCLMEIRTIVESRLEEDCA